MKMSDEQKLVNAFRMLDPTRRAQMVVVMQALAKEFPCTVPRLRLVASGVAAMNDRLGQRAAD